MAKKENFKRLIDNEGADYLDYINPNLSLTVSEAHKRKNDYAWAKHLIDYYDGTIAKSPEEMERYDENYELHRGSWSKIEDYEDKLSFKINQKEYGVGGLRLRHFPIINTISMRILGEIVQKPLIPVVRDFSASSKNYRDRYRMQVTQDYLYNKLVKPREDAIRQNFFTRLGIEDPRQLNPEQQQQAEQQVQQMLSQSLPNDLKQSMDSQMSPEEIIFQNFLKHIIKEQKINDKFITGAENSIVTGEEYYRINVINGKPRVEVLNPKYVTWQGSEHTEFVEDGTFVKYEQYLTPQDIIQKYGQHLMSKDIKELERLFIDFGQSDSSNNGSKWKRLEETEVFANYPELQDFVGQVNTKEGQEKLALIYSMFSNHNRGGAGMEHISPWGIRECYIAFKWQRWMKLVTREVNGKRVELWKADHYTKNKSKGDLKVERKLVPQVWHGVVLGEAGSSVKINVEPVPWQYNSLKNPFDVKLPIHGRKLNTHMNNTRNVSFIDLGKQYQYEYNSLRRDWEKYRRTNIGKIVLATVDAIPDGMDIGDFYNMLDTVGIGFVDSKYDGSNPMFDMNAFRNFDLSKATDMASVLRDMEYVKNEMYQAMYYNTAKLGQQGQYTTATTAQMNIQAADAQLAKFHDLRRQIKERVLEYTLNVTIAAYAEDDDMKAKVLDDISIAYLESNYEYLSTREYNIFVVDDYRENQKLEFIRQQLQAFIQNGANVEEVVAIAKAESLAEMQEIAERVERRNAENMKAQREQELAVLQNTKKAEFDLVKYQEEMRNLREERKHEVEIARAELLAMQMANANDIDQNKVPDSLQRAMLEIQSKERIKDKELDYKRWETNQKTAKKG